MTQEQADKLIVLLTDMQHDMKVGMIGIVLLLACIGIVLMVKR